MVRVFSALVLVSESGCDKGRQEARLLDQILNRSAIIDTVELGSIYATNYLREKSAQDFLAALQQTNRIAWKKGARREHTGWASLWSGTNELIVIGIYDGDIYMIDDYCFKLGSSPKPE